MAVARLETSIKKAACQLRFVLGADACPIRLPSPLYFQYCKVSMFMTQGRTRSQFQRFSAAPLNTLDSGGRGVESPSTLFAQ